MKQFSLDETYDYEIYEAYENHEALESQNSGNRWKPWDVETLITT